MTIRQGNTEDVAAVMEVVKKVVPVMRAAGNLQWDDVYPNAEVFQRDVDQEQMWVAEIEGIIAGVAALTGDHEHEYEQVGWDLNEPAIVIHRVAVDPGYQGQGIAKALMQQAEIVARERDIGVLRVDTSKQNQVTQRLFPKLGYTFAGEIGLGFRPGLRVLCYEKRLA
jgi:ribosomal protein S18 acetylase RimI-like enzyme